MEGLLMVTNKASLVLAAIVLIVSLFIANSAFAENKSASEIYQQAINDFNKAIELNPKDAEAYNNRGLAYEYLGNHQKAINDYNKSIKLNPKDAMAYNNRGIAYEYLENHQQAINDFNKAIELNPKYAKAYYNRGIVYNK